MTPFFKSPHPFQNKEEIILRDFLALERTRLANERTLFAYIRTALYLVLAGIAFLQIQELSNIHYLGYISLALSVFFFFFGLFRFQHLKKTLKQYYTRPGARTGTGSGSGTGSGHGGASSQRPGSRPSDRGQNRRYSNRNQRPSSEEASRNQKNAPQNSSENSSQNQRRTPELKRQNGGQRPTPGQAPKNSLD